MQNSSHFSKMWLSFPLQIQASWWNWISAMVGVLEMVSHIQLANNWSASCNACLCHRTETETETVNWLAGWYPQAMCSQCFRNGNQGQPAKQLDRTLSGVHWTTWILSEWHGMEPALPFFPLLVLATLSNVSFKCNQFRIHKHPHIEYLSVASVLLSSKW